MQLLHPRQQVVRHHRRDGDRNDHAGKDGNDVGHAQRREQATLDAGQDEQRHEHQHDDHGRIDDRRAHFQRRRRDHFGHRPRFRQRAVELEAAQDVLDADHGIVHQLADGDGQPAQRHGVDGQAEIAEYQRRHQQRERDGRQGDQCRADIEQEEEEDHRHQDGAVAQRLHDVADRVLDEVSLLEEELRRLDALGQGLRQVDQGALDFARQRHAVGGRLLLHGEDHGGPGVVAGVAALDGRRQLDLGDLLEEDGLAIPERHHQILQVLDAAGAPDLADQVFAALGFEKTAAGVGAKVLECTFQFLALDAQTLQLRGLQLDAVLPHLTADRDHLGDAGNGEQARPHHPVGVLAHLHRADLVRIGRQRNQQDLAHDRGDRPELRHDALGKLFAHQVQPFGDLLAVAVDVRAPLELDIDDGQADAGDRAYAGDARHAVHARLDGEGDELLDLLRRHAAGLGHQRHGGLVEVGEDIHRHLADGQRAVDHQQQRDTNNNEPLFQAGVDDGLEHLNAPVPADWRRR